MPENWYALCISILRGVPPEEAFELYNNCGRRKRMYKKHIRESDVEDMIKLKDSHTYQQIGDMYGMSESSVYRRIKRFKEKRGLN